MIKVFLFSFVLGFFLGFWVFFFLKQGPIVILRLDQNFPWRPGHQWTSDLFPQFLSDSTEIWACATRSVWSVGFGWLAGWFCVSLFTITSEEPNSFVMFLHCSYHTLHTQECLSYKSFRKIILAVLINCLLWYERKKTWMIKNIT